MNGVHEGKIRLRRRREGEGENASGLWLITFTDIMALMLTFFVLMYSMSSPDEDKWKDVSSGLNAEFTSQTSPEWYESGPQEISILRLGFSDALNLSYLSTLVSGAIAADERLKSVILTPHPDYLAISLPEDLLFRPGESGISEEGRRALFATGGILSRIRNRIEVVGHAGPPPSAGSGEKARSGWELSLARAATVAGELEDSGYGRPILIRGLYADPRARHVDILIMRDGGKQKSLLEFE